MNLAHHARATRGPRARPTEVPRTKRLQFQSGGNKTPMPPEAAPEKRGHAAGPHWHTACPHWVSGFTWATPRSMIKNPLRTHVMSFGRAQSREVTGLSAE